MPIQIRSSNKLVYVQYLRAFAALLVLSFHLDSGINSYWISSKHIELFTQNAGNIGVAIFYCITGFIVPYSSLNKKRGFYKFLLPKVLEFIQHISL